MSGDPFGDGNFLLWLQYIALVDPAAAKKAVRHHGLAKQKYEAYQEGQ